MTTVDVWEGRIQQTQDRYPETRHPLTRDTTRRVVAGEEVIARILRDVLSIDNVEVRRGQRPRLDPDEGRRLLHDIQGQDYTVEPFHVAFRALAGTRSLENLRRQTGLSRANLGRLMNQKPPRKIEMEIIAESFGKRASYFAEYRALMFAELVRQHLANDPDRSAALAHRYGVR